jgi:hypothetical protein
LCWLVRKFLELPYSFDYDTFALPRTDFFTM